MRNLRHIAVYVLLVISLPAFSGSPRWPGLGGSFCRTGTSPFAGPEQGCIRWAFETGESVTASIAIGPAGQVYLGSEDGFLYAVDPNGFALWQYDARSPVTTAPAVGDDGTVYIGTLAGTLLAVDSNGSTRWSAATQGSIYTAPAIVDGLVIAGSLDGTLYAFDAAGDTAWTFTPADLDSIVAAPSVDPDGTIYVGRLYDPNLYALNAADGSIRWNRDLSHHIIPDDPAANWVSTGFQIAPVVHPDGFVLTAPTHDGKIYALDPADGEIEWTLNLTHPPEKPLHATVPDDIYESQYGYSDIWSEPVIGPDGTIYVSMDDMFLRAIRPDGTLKWIRRVGMYGGLTMTVDRDGRIYAASDDKSLYVLEPQNGDIISVMTLFGTKSNAFASAVEEWLSYPVLGADGRLYVGSSAGTLYAIGTGDCQTKTLHRPANLSGDGRIDIEDLARMGEQWQFCLHTIFPGQQCHPGPGWYPLDFPYPQADINRDFYVNMDDLALLIEHWLQEENR